MFHTQTEGSKLQRDLRAYLEAVKGDTHKLMQRHIDKSTHAHVTHVDTKSWMYKYY